MHGCLPFRLYWLNDRCSDGVVEVPDYLLGLCQTSSLLRIVLFHVLLERVLQARKRSLRPVEGRDVQFVDWFASSGGKTAKEAAMETRLER